MIRLVDHEMTPRLRNEQEQARVDAARCRSRITNGRGPLTRTVVAVNFDKRLARLNTGEIMPVAEAYTEKLKPTRDLYVAEIAYARCSFDIWFEIHLNKFR